MPTELASNSARLHLFRSPTFSSAVAAVLSRSKRVVCRKSRKMDYTLNFIALLAPTTTALCLLAESNHLALSVDKRVPTSALIIIGVLMAE